MTDTLTIDLDSVRTIVDAEELYFLGSYALSDLADAMQDVADRHGIAVRVRFERASGRRRDEDRALWERLAIALVDEVRAEVGL